MLLLSQAGMLLLQQLQQAGMVLLQQAGMLLLHQAKNILKCQICPFRVVLAQYGPIFRKNETTASLKPTAHLLAPKTHKKRSGK